MIGGRKRETYTPLNAIQASGVEACLLTNQ
jgi:hypothetical protein